MPCKLMTLRLARIFLFILMGFGYSHPCSSQDRADDNMIEKVDQVVGKLMKKGNIPGLSLVVINNGRQTIRTYGYADLQNKTRVTPHTLFQIGSCTKAFTALAVLQWAQQGAIDLNGTVDHYIPWFRSLYKDSAVRITLLQLLHHTGGIPWQTIAGIPTGNDPGALERSIRSLSPVELHNLPGKKYEYATMNYDILALIIQQTTHQSFEDYLQKNIISKLHLDNTSIGTPLEIQAMSTGYKIGFFRARGYKAPEYRANNAAGYVISNAIDMAKWLQFQLGMTPAGLFDLAKETHQRDQTVPLHDMSAYAMGWNVSLNGNGAIFHDGLNPNFTSFIALQPDSHTAIVLLANANSNYTDMIGNRILQVLAGEKLEKEPDPGDGGDRAFSLVSFIMGAYILVVLAFLIRVMVKIADGTRKYQGPLMAQLKRFALALLIALPFLAGLYILPRAIAGFTWDSIVVWTPVSFKIMTLLVLAALGISYGAYLISLFFPEKNKFLQKAPRIILMSVVSGICNMVVIVLVTSALDTGMELKYLIFYYILVITGYLLGRWFVQVNLIKITREIIYQLRIDLIEKIFSTSYQKFEKIDRGRIYMALNDDVDTIGNSTNMVVTLITSSITAIGAFLYLASIAFWATILTIFMILALSVIYYFVGQSNNKYYRKARETTAIFVRLIGDMIDGYKEISLHKNKKAAFKTDVADKANEYRKEISTADIRFTNAFLIGESMLLVLLGIVAFAVPKLFPDIALYTVMGFVLVLLYLIGPINGILTASPAILQMKIAWKRVRQFLNEIPSAPDLDRDPETPVGIVHSIKAVDLEFRYRNEQDQDVFWVGPVSLEVNKGEILFIIGGNGSGKTTLAKLLTGLYEPQKGLIMINDKPVGCARLGEYFSAVFNPVYLFETLYSLDLTHRSEEVQRVLQRLDLQDKVAIKENKYTTIDLSGGQRKRLALLQCYLESSQIYLFDEWAADQDPAYRNFFYRTLLPEMKSAGKIVIAITHDDHYFDVADKVLKMNGGKLEAYDAAYSLDAQL